MAILLEEIILLLFVKEICFFLKLLHMINLFEFLNYV
jgi:hypothetical protein